MGRTPTIRRICWGWSSMIHGSSFGGAQDRPQLELSPGALLWTNLDYFGVALHLEWIVLYTSMPVCVHIYIYICERTMHVLYIYVCVSFWSCECICIVYVHHQCCLAQSALNHILLWVTMSYVRTPSLAGKRRSFGVFSAVAVLLVC